MEDVYERLRQKLDDLATGYPATEARAEIRILEQLFTKEEAEFFLRLSPRPETPEEVAKRLDRDPEDSAGLLETMAKKGLLFRHRKGETVRYAAVPYIVGFFEFQINRMDRELALDMNEYFETALGETIQAFKTPVMRTIPVNREVAVKWPIAPYEDVLQILEDQKTVAIVPCICRTWMKHADKGCDKPVETCFMFGSHAHYYVENGMGRYIDREEAREILKRNEEVGLVMQPFNSQKVGGMCSCCGDCCGMLRSLKKQPVPAAAVQSNYYAEVDPDDCAACETCMERCPMDAVKLDGEFAEIIDGRCIGCGVCIPACPEEAISLAAIPGIKAPPIDWDETFQRMKVERGLA